MVPDSMLRDAWLRAEGFCECRNTGHGHERPCGQFLIWQERGETGRGGWEAWQSERRHGSCEILCAPCYAKATGRVPRRGEAG